MTVTRWDEHPAATNGGRDVVDGWAVQLAGVAQLAEYIASTDFVPKAYRDQPAAVAAAILAGREMGIGPMTALQHLYVVEGRPAMSAQLMRALVMAAGHTLRVVESTSARCTVTGRRRGESADREPVTWTGEEVRRAGLANRPTWQRYPRQMLLARATAELCRAVFPDVLGGMAYAIEEAEDMPAGEPPPERPEPSTTKTVRRRNLTPPSGAVSGRSGPPSPGSTTDRATAAPPNPATPSAGPGGSPPPLPGDAEPVPAVRITRGPDTPNRPATPAGGPLPDDDGTAGPDTPEPEPGSAEPPETGEASPVEERTPKAPAGDAATDDTNDPASGRQRGHVFALLTELGAMAPRARRLAILSALVGREITSTNELTRGEATPLIDVLVRVTQSNDPQAELDYLVAAGTARVVLGARDVTTDEPTDDGGEP